jgi:hypothetical protein
MALRKMTIINVCGEQGVDLFMYIGTLLTSLQLRATLELTRAGVCPVVERSLQVAIEIEI